MSNAESYASIIWQLKVTDFSGLMLSVYLLHCGSRGISLSITIRADNSGLKVADALVKWTEAEAQCGCNTD